MIKFNPYNPIYIRLTQKFHHSPYNEFKDYAIFLQNQNGELKTYIILIGPF